MKQENSPKIRVLVVGCGNMGASHARAYSEIDEFEIVGLVSPNDDREALGDELGVTDRYSNYEEALLSAKPDAVAICTYPDTHAAYAIKALEAGSHVFVEKPLADTIQNAQSVIDKAKQVGKKVLVGYILRHHPSWMKFVEISQTLGKPLVMRMNLNQQSSGDMWQVHQRLMSSMSPIVDCGVHYVDMMCLMTRSRPIRVHAIGAHLSDCINDHMYNYGQLQVVFEDGSIGWYEAGWGPMVSEAAFFIKDVIGPNGCVSIVSAGDSKSDDVDSHTKTNRLLLHHSQLDSFGKFARADENIDMTDEPAHQELCNREQRYFLKAIRENLDMTSHLHDAINSLRVVLAADESIKTGKTVELAIK